MTDSVMVDGVRTIPSRDGRLIVNPGSRLSMECLGDGFPAPGISFEKDSSVLTPGGRIRMTNTTGGGRRITISSADAADEGRYRCVAASTAGSDSSFVDVVVQGNTGL